ncbi:hypothetical protein MHYP_G00257630 [Metynnis hypsauchen]
MALAQGKGNLLRAWSANPVHSGMEGGNPQDSLHSKTGGRWKGGGRQENCLRQFLAFNGSMVTERTEECYTNCHLEHTCLPTESC